MNVSQLVAVPDGLRAVYAVTLKQHGDEGFKTFIVDRVVDAMGLLELEAQDIRSTPGERQGAVRGRKTKIVGIIMEGMIEPKPAPLATEWFERLYGAQYVRADFLGYTRDEKTVDQIMAAVMADAKNGVEFPDGEETPEMRETRRYWVKAVRESQAKK